jgi:hypothetical protein
MATFSLTTSSCATRFAWSGTPASSRTITSIFLPATLLPLRSMKSFRALCICLPYTAKGPVTGAEKPIRMVSWAHAISAPKIVTAPTSSLINALGNFSGWMMGEIISLQHMAFLRLWKANGEYA